MAWGRAVTCRCHGPFTSPTYSAAVSSTRPAARGPQVAWARLPRSGPPGIDMGAALTCPARRRLALLLLLTLMLSACSPRLMLVRGMADQLAAQAQGQEDDLVLARDASPFYLKLSEAVLSEAPDHLALSEAVARGLTQYAYAFVAFEAERLQAHDARAAQAQQERAARLYARARRQALATLLLHQPRLLQDLATGEARVPAEQVGLAYWAAAAWAAQISLSKDQPDVVADLPLAQRLAAAAWQAQPGHAQGGLAALMGTLEAAMPGGRLDRAGQYFDQAVQFGAGRQAGVFVARAEALALPAGDRAAFEGALHQALAISRAHRDVGNEVMRLRAQWLLASIDDLF